MIKVIDLRILQEYVNVIAAITVIIIIEFTTTIIVYLLSEGAAQWFTFVLQLTYQQPSTSPGEERGPSLTNFFLLLWQNLSDEKADEK